MLRLNFHFNALFKVISLTSLVIFSSCSSAPKVNKNWLAQNCSAPADFKPDKCIAWSNCKTLQKPSAHALMKMERIMVSFLMVNIMV